MGIAQGLIGIIGGILTLLRPRIALSALLFLQVLLTRNTPGVDFGEQLYISAFVGVMLGWVIRVMARRSRIRRTPLNTPIAIFLAFCTMSFTQAYSTGVPIAEWSKHVMKFYNLALFFPFTSEYRTRAHLLFLLKQFLVVAMIMTLVDLYGMSKAGVTTYKLAGPEYTSIYFLLAIPILVASFSSPKLKLREVLVLCLFIVAFHLRLIVSLMRSYIVAWLLMCALTIGKIVFFRGRAQRIVVILVGLASALGIILTYNVEYATLIASAFNRVLTEELASEVNISAWIRLEEMEAAWETAWQRPFFGHGFGYRYTYYRPTIGYCSVPYAHCVPLYIFVALGIVGISVIAWWIKRLYFLALTVARRESLEQWKALCWALNANFLGLAVLSVVTNVVTSQTSLFYFALSMSVLSALKHIQDKEIGGFTERRDSVGQPDRHGNGLHPHHRPPAF